jgi:hypothetical protein
LNLYRPEFSSTAIAIPRNPKPSFLGRGLLSYFVVVLVVAVLSVVFREILVSRNSVIYQEERERERERERDFWGGFFIDFVVCWGLITVEEGLEANGGLTEWDRRE